MTPPQVGAFRNPGVYSQSSTFMNRKVELKLRVHFSLDVLWASGTHPTSILVPGQAFPVTTVQDSIIEDLNPVNGHVELKVYTALFRGDSVYTDTATAPVTKEYVDQEEMRDYANIHSMRGGFGITVLNPENQIPGSFSSTGRTILPYSLRELYDREEASEYVAGPACHMRIVPSIFAKLRPNVTSRQGDMELLDAETGETAMFRKLPLPLVLGSYDTFYRHPDKWQKKLLRDFMSPARYMGVYLHTLLESAGIYDYTRYYFAFPSKKPAALVPLEKRGRLRTAVIPYKRHDVWQPIDLGRNRVFHWDKVFLSQHSS